MTVATLRDPTVLRWSLLAVVCLQLPGLQLVVKHTPEALRPWVGAVELLALLVYALGLVALVRRPNVQRALEGRGVLAALTAIVIAAIAIGYPWADGLSAHGGGSDADDAMKQVALSILGGGNGYDASTYLGNPISPGSGWALLWAPLTVVGAYPMINVVALLLCAGALGREGGRGALAGSLMMMLCMSSPGFWRAIVTGNDLPAIGACTVAVALWLLRTERTAVLWTLAITLGLIATSRVVFAYLPCLVAFAIYRRSPRRALLVALVGSAVCAAVHLTQMQLVAGDYPPLHLLDKGTRAARTTGPLGLWLPSAGAALLMLRRWELSPPAWHLWLGLFVPLLTVALGELAAMEWAVAMWGGTDYLLVAVPPFAAWLAGELTPPVETHNG